MYSAFFSAKDIPFIFKETINFIENLEMTQIARGRVMLFASL